MSTIWLVAKREFRVRALSKANIITSLIMLAIIVGGAFVGRVFLGGGEAATEVVHVDRAAVSELMPYLEASAAQREAPLEFVAVDTPAEPALAEGVVAIIGGSAGQPEVFLEDERGDIVEITAAAASAYVLDREISGLGGDPAEVGQALAQAVPTVTLLGDADEFDPGSFFAGAVVIIALLFILIQSASVIMMGVVEEKVSRVVEILLATVRPSELLGGKILGVGLFALTQAVTLVAPMIFAAWYLDILKYVEVGIGPLLVNFAVWFLLGFALYAILFGGLAALVSRQEDLGSVTTPMMLLMMAPLYLGIYLVPSSPDGTVTKVLTQIPFFAPFMVPMRTAFGAIAGWEIALAVVLCLATIPVAVWVAGRVYVGAVLNTGGSMNLGEALRRA